MPELQGNVNPKKKLSSDGSHHQCQRAKKNCRVGKYGDICLDGLAVELLLIEASVKSESENHFSMLEGLLEFSEVRYKRLHTSLFARDIVHTLILSQPKSDLSEFGLHVFT